MPEPLNKTRLFSARLLVVGDVMLDRYLWGDVSRISPEAPVQVLHVRKRSEVCGGAGNVVSNLIGLGCSASVVGVCGADEDGRHMLRLLRAPGLECRIAEDASRPTVTKTRIVSKSQQLLRIDEEEPLPLDEALHNTVLASVTHTMDACDAVILSDYGKGVLHTPGLAQQIIELAARHGLPVLVDPKGRDWDRYRGATCITPNTREFEQVCDRQFADEAALVKEMKTTIAHYDLESLLVTRGAEGMCLVSRDESQTPTVIRSAAREVYDVSGAGDTVIATFGACIAAGMPFAEAASLANTAGGVVVGKVGTHPISLSELEAAVRLGDGTSLARYTTKVVSPAAAAVRIQQWKAAGERVVFTNGCFDLLHPGHIHLLNKAKDLGAHLVVGLNSDASVSRLKGSGRPILSEHDRASVVGSLDCVDLVIVFNCDTPEPLLHDLEPDVLVKGSNYNEKDVVGRDIVEAYGGTVHLLPVLQGYSSDLIVDKVLKSNGETFHGYVQEGT